MSLLFAHNLGKRYGRTWLFRSLEIELTHGECLVVTGQNGSGKSTLLKCLAGLTDATEGSLKTEIDDPRTDLGYSALDQSTYPQLTAREHLAIIADLRGCPSHRLSPAEDLLEMVGLKDRDLPAAQLSSGQRSRLRLAIAIQAQPKILLLDEPGAAMDELGRDLVEKIVRAQLERGCVIIATNDPSERRFATHVLPL